MRGLQWLGLGTIIGVAATAAGFLLLSDEGRDAVERTSKASSRVGEGVVDLIDKVSGGVERVAAVVGKGIEHASEETGTQMEHVANSARKTVRDVGHTMTPR